MDSQEAARLPLAVARLRRRSWNAKSAKDRHDTAYFALEVSVRLAVAAAPPADPRSLARASVGKWVAALHVRDAVLDDPALVRLGTLFLEHGAGDATPRHSIRLRELFGALAAYRNHIVGHGSPREASFYAEAAQTLIAGLDAAWQGELFLPMVSQCVYVESIAVLPDGSSRARLLQLNGESPLLLDPTGSTIPQSIRPRRVYLVRGSSWTLLHPWVAFDEETERLYCFNSYARKAEFLDYSSGEFIGGSDLEGLCPGMNAELAALFAGAASVGPAPAPSVSDAPNEFGDFELLESIGAGAMGEIWLARQRSLDRLVALKLLSASLGSDAIAVARFQREIQALARCEHPNVVKIFASGERAGRRYYAMEHVEGADLRAVAKGIAAGAPFDRAVETACAQAVSPRGAVGATAPAARSAGARSAGAHARGSGDTYRRLAAFFRDAALGLQHLHDNGIVHRDISPGNLMVAQPGSRAVVMDLGLAAVKESSLSLTGDAGQLLGTLRYMPPERLQRRLVPPDARADIYSLGATMYELVTGRRMIDGDEGRLFDQILNEQPTPPERIVPSLPRDISVIVGKAVEKDARMRYQSAGALAADLDAFLLDRPIAARPPTLRYVLRLAIERNKPLAATIAAALLVTVCLGALALAKAVQASTQSVQRQALGDARSAEVLVNQADALYPAMPDMAPAMKAWLEETDDLLLRWPEQERQASLARRTGLHWSEKQRTAFAGQLASLGRLTTEIRNRQQTALDLEQKTIGDHAAEWAAVRARVAANPLYGGLHLEPQLGLVPLQQNPLSHLEEFWVSLSGDAPRIAEADTGVLALSDDSAIVLVLIPGGNHALGDARDEDPPFTHLKPDEAPRVAVLDAYFIGKHEVSQAQWTRLMGSNPAVYSANHRLSEQVFPDYKDYEITWLHPVESVSWLDCIGFVERLGLRLPSDDEWEAACRAGERAPWVWGADYGDLDGHENVADISTSGLFALSDSDFPDVTWDDRFPLHAPIDQFPPNGFGLCSMHGNVAEWCADVWTADTFATDPPRRRFFRGGSFRFPPGMAIAWLRQYDHMRSVLAYRGLRVARSLAGSSH